MEEAKIMKLKSILIILLCLIIFFLSGCGKTETNVEGEIFFEHSTPADYQELDNTKIGWGFKKEKGIAPSVPQSITHNFEKYNAFYLGNTSEKNLYLTFDEGYENGYTAAILDVLKKTETPAAFFVTGDYIKTEPELVKRMCDEGHIVGNHTKNHPSMPDKTDSECINEINSLNDMYKDLTGKEMKYIRPPMGEFSERTLSVSNDLGYKTVFWSFAYVDWKKDEIKGSDYAYNSVMPYLHDGAVILLHAVSKDNAEALERIITSAKEQGYSFKSLDEIE